MDIKKYTAELIGTFGLTLAVMMSIVHNKLGIPTPVVAALTLAMFVFTIGKVSGCHINPGVTLGLFSVGKIKPKDALGYIVAQVIGALLAYFVITTVFSYDGTKEFAKASLGTKGIEIFLGELLGMFFFTFGIAAVVFKKTDEAITEIQAPFIVGGSLLLGIIVAAAISGGVLNPAVAVGVNKINWAYLLGPVVGSLLGFNIYKAIFIDN